MKNQEEEKLGVGVCGCGAISRIYLQNMIHRFSNLAVVSCCARHLEHAQKRAEEFGIEAMTYEEMLQDE
ncbi:MAG: Gfo/Idh/MocA family oxidoreductase, partial [Lachnospiraceae bacterium]|nr:Gfo/Idh/MocA family oxidoreductase [Lachnospiraceae bacterium]